MEENIISSTISELLTAAAELNLYPITEKFEKQILNVSHRFEFKKGVNVDECFIIYVYLFENKNNNNVDMLVYNKKFANVEINSIDVEYFTYIIKIYKKWCQASEMKNTTADTKQQNT